MQAGLAVVCGQDSATAAVAVVFKKNINAAKNSRSYQLRIGYFIEGE